MKSFRALHNYNSTQASTTPTIRAHFIYKIFPFNSIEFNFNKLKTICFTENNTNYFYYYLI